MDKVERKELKKFIENEVKSNSSPLSTLKLGYYNILKYSNLVFIFLFFGQIFFGQELNKKKESLSASNITLILSCLFISCWSHILTLKYKPTFKIEQDEWMRRNHRYFIVFFSIGLIFLLTFLYLYMPESPIINIILIFILTSFIGFYFCVFLIFAYPHLFFNHIITGIGTFFLITNFWSWMQFILVFILFQLSSTGVLSHDFLLNNPSTTEYYLWVLGAILPAFVDFDLDFIISNEKLDFTQKYVVRVISPKKIFQSFKNSKSIIKAELAALEMFVELEKEGNEYKQKALLLYLSKKHQPKNKKLKGYLIGAIIFIICALLEGLIQTLFLEPIKKFLNF